MSKQSNSIGSAFAQALRERRRHMRLTQAALAELSGLSMSYISFLECGQRQPTLNVIVGLATALGFERTSELVALAEQIAEANTKK